MAKRIQYGNTPWGAAWIEALKSGSRNGYEDPRLTRGRAYASAGKVRDVAFVGFTVHGRVQGSGRSPYTVKVEIRPFTPAQKSTLFAFLAANPLIVQELSRGTMPAWFLAWLLENNLPIAPVSWSEMMGDCSCPDWGSPCKHQVAVFYALSHEIDRSPLSLFRLRGITAQEIDRKSVV